MRRTAQRSENENVPQLSRAEFRAEKLSPASNANAAEQVPRATWYCWYSETKSFMLLSASVNLGVGARKLSARQISVSIKNASNQVT